MTDHTTGHAERREAELQEDTRRRAHEIQASEQAAAAALEHDEVSPDAEIAHVPRSVHHHDHNDTAAYQRPSAARRSGPRR